MLSKKLIKAAAGNAAEAGYQVPQSLRFNSADSANLNRTFVAGNRKTWTWSAWIKLSSTADTNIFAFGTSPSSRGAIQYFNSKFSYFSNPSGSSETGRLDTVGVYRDLSAWYHLVYVLDTTQATASDRIKLYINGERASVTTTNPSQNEDSALNQAGLHRLGAAAAGTSAFVNGYLTEVHFVDGQALTPSDFGETDTTTGVWKPKAYAGDYGTNGFYLPFTNNNSEVDLGISAIPYTSDQGWNRTSLLLNTNGVDAAQNNTFLDSSTNNFTITRNGNTAQGRFSPFADGWSNYFDGSGDYLSMSDNAAFDFGAPSGNDNDFTFECWFYLTADASADNSGNKTATIFSGYNGVSPYNGYEISVIGNSSVTGTALRLNQYISSVAYTAQTVLTVSKNEWHHFAIVRYGSTYYIYFDGTRYATSSPGNLLDTETLNASGTIKVGASSESGYLHYFPGYISNVRITKNAALYTAASITVPTSPLTTTVSSGTVSYLSCQSNRFVDNSTNNFTITRNGDVKVTAFNPFTPTQDYSASVNGGSGYFDGTSDRLSTDPDPGLGLGTNTWTIEFWTYPTSSVAGQTFVSQCDTNDVSKVAFNANGYPYLQIYQNGANKLLYQPGPAATLNAWNHVALVHKGGGEYQFFLNGKAQTKSSVSSDYWNGTLGSSTSFNIGYNCSANNNYLTGYMSGLRIVYDELYTADFDVPTAPPTNITNTSLLLNFTNAGIVDASGKNNIETVGDAQVDTAVTKWGSSMKFDGTGDYLTAGSVTDFKFIHDKTSDYTIECWVYPTVLSGRKAILETGAASASSGALLEINGTALDFTIYRGVSGSYTYATGGTLTANSWQHIAASVTTSQVKIFLNGVLLATTTWSLAGSTASQQTNLTIGGDVISAVGDFTGYIEDLRITKGLARYTGNFTVPDAPFAYDKSDINYKQWQPNNFSVTAGTGNDSLVDTPTPYGDDTGAGGEVRGNYCTLNPLKNQGNTLGNGNLNITATTTSGTTIVFGTIGMSSGKWYWEYTQLSMTVITNASMIGIAKDNASLAAYVGSDANGYGYYGTGNKYTNNSASAYGAGYTNNDVMGVAFDADAGTLVFYKNGVSQGTAFSGLTSGPYFPAFSDGGSTTVMTAVVNFGQRPFAYTAPSGFKALCTQNLPTPTVKDGGDYFNTVLYTGDNTNDRSITGVGFQPDWVWIKARSIAYNHRLADAVRGAGKELFSNLTNAEVTNNADGYVSSFDSDGFSLTSGIGVNENTKTYAAWNWNAGGSNVTNTDGTITSTVRANPTAGFSIVSYTGNGSTNQTAGHGLGVKPKLKITKSRSIVEPWVVTGELIGPADYRMFLDTTAAVGTAAGFYPADTTTTIGLSGSNVSNGHNQSGQTYISYVFAEIEGFSKFGSYTGNGSTDGPFVYCGFRPAWVLFKRTSTTSNWDIFDTARGTYNSNTPELQPNTSAAETSVTGRVDLLSNGFKLTSSLFPNDSGVTFIFAAFAENPFKYSLAR